MADKTNKINIKACYLRPHPDCPLFVACNGVIVIVYDGFPPSLIQVKEGLELSTETTTYPSPNPNPKLKLKKENFGSKWPKTTLAAVFDNASELTCEELIRLKQLCYHYGQKFHHRVNIDHGDDDDDDDDEDNNDNDIIRVNTLSFVNYECRSLEKLNLRIDISLKNNGFDFTNPSNKEKDIVNSVVNEWSDGNNELGIAEEYLSKVNQPGSRMNSYRQSIVEESKTGEAKPSTSATTDNKNDDNDTDDACSMNNIDGVTCVTFLNDNDSQQSDFPDRYRQILIDFRIAVDIEFPGRYAWFAEKSLHCTIRPLDTDTTEPCSTSS